MATAHVQNPYLPHTLRSTARSKSARQPPPVALDRSGLPVGTAAQIIEWVGDDPDRAMRSLAKEQAETRPRVSLVASLTAVLKRHEIPLAVPTEDPVAQETEDSVSDEPGVDPLALVREGLGVESP